MLVILINVIIFKIINNNNNNNNNNKPINTVYGDIKTVVSQKYYKVNINNLYISPLYIVY
jgi:hypothetical protein